MFLWRNIESYLLIEFFFKIGFYFIKFKVLICVIRKEENVNICECICIGIGGREVIYSFIFLVVFGLGF